MSSPPPQPPRPTNPPPQPPPSPRPKVAVAEEMYPVAELAAIWRCSENHIYNLIAKRQLTAVQIGIGRAKTRIPASAAAEFVAKRATKGRAA